MYMYKYIYIYIYIYIYMGCFSNTIGQNTTNGNGNLAQC